MELQKVSPKCLQKIKARLLRKIKGLDLINNEFYVKGALDAYNHALKELDQILRPVFCKCGDYAKIKGKCQRCYGREYNLKYKRGKNKQHANNTN